MVALKGELKVLEMQQQALKGCKEKFAIEERAANSERIRELREI